MKKMFNLIKVFSLLVLFTATPLIFAGGNTSGTVGQTINTNNSAISAEIRALEAEIRANNSDINRLNSQKIAYIQRENLSWWEQRQDMQVKDWDSQIKKLENQNRSKEAEIRKLRRKLK